MSVSLKRNMYEFIKANKVRGADASIMESIKYGSKHNVKTIIAIR